MTEKNGNATPQDFPGAAAMKHLAELGVKASDMSVTMVPTEGLGEGLPPAVPIGWNRNEQKPLSLKPLIEEFRSRPERRKGTASAQTLLSFVDLVKRQMDADSAIFADMNWKAPKFTAVIDYHRLEGADGSHEPRWLGHRIEYAFPIWEDWKKWIAFDGQVLGQVEFAAFIEDRIADLAAPAEAERTFLEEMFKTKIADPFEVLQLSRGLSVTVNAQVVSARNLQTGEAEIVYQETHNDGGGRKTLSVPGLFMASVPVFHSGMPVRVPARLRYRAKEGGIKWFFQFWRPDYYVTEQIRKDRDAVQVETGLPVYEGAPEA